MERAAFEQKKPLIWKFNNYSLFLFAAVTLLLIFQFYDALSYMVKLWGSREEYGHSYLIPVITLFLIWQKKNELEKVEFVSSSIGLLVVLIGLFLFYAGELSSLYIVTQYSFLIVLYGIILTLIGWRAFKIIAAPLFMLILMMPLPDFLFKNLSSQLQLISSQLGVSFIRLFDISVYLEGNVIDLGQLKLQVVEACSGLNYLFPLMTLGFIAAYFFTGEFWKKVIIFLTTIPITVLMNSFRIGAIGISVEYWGQEMAEGVLHDFEGWVVFMGCIGILIVEMWILANVGKTRLPLREAFGLEFPSPTPENAKIKYRHMPLMFIASMVLLVITSISTVALPERQEIQPERKNYVSFPLQLEGWDGKRGYLEQEYIDVLKFDDYLVLNYFDSKNRFVEFYSAYYSSQRKGSSAHSPKTCIPGGGWRITSHTLNIVKNVSISNIPLQVNRLVIEKGDVKQLVYYWFQQRGRIITNEYMMKWYLFWDAVTRNRTDGALMRLSTTILPGDSLESADSRLTDVATKISGLIPEYVTN